MSDIAFDPHLPAELEARTDDVIRQLDELNQRVERALADVLPAVACPDRLVAN